MTRRRLSKNQTRRIRRSQQASLKRAEQNAETGKERRGRVVAHYGKQVDVESGTGEIVRCFLRANLDSIVTGDHIIFHQSNRDNVVISREERRTLLSRCDSFGKLKPVAANVDKIVVTISPRPEAHRNLIDRYLVIAEINQINALILINKVDLLNDDNRPFFDTLHREYEALGYPVMEVSVKNNHGFDKLSEILTGKTSIFVGQSGVGKSSIIQRLVPEQSIDIGRLSAGVDKGRHTTTHSKLYHFSFGGECIDSPGIREFGLWHLSEEQVLAGFVEMREFADQCKFRNCRHQGEPGCAVLKALRQNQISQARFDSFQTICSTLDDVSTPVSK